MGTGLLSCREIHIIALKLATTLNNNLDTGGAVRVRQEEPGPRQRLHPRPRGDEDQARREDPPHRLRGQHGRPAGPDHGVQPGVRPRGHLPPARRVLHRLQQVGPPRAEHEEVRKNIELHRKCA